MPGIAGSKTEANPALRYDYLTWAKTVLPDALRQNIIRINAYKGTGAWIGTYGIQLNPLYVGANPAYRDVTPQDNFVLSLLKPNARTYGLKFIDYLLQLGEMAKTANPEAHKSVAPLLEMIRQGRRMVLQETDLRHSWQQEKAAADYFNTLKITVGKTPIEFFTQNAFDCGEDFRISFEVKGPHFNQLALTEDKTLFKRKTAIALFTAVSGMCLSCKPANRDMHGDNVGVEGKSDKIKIGIFDNGALDINAPTKVQKRVLADCVFNALVNTVRNGYGFPSSLKHTIAKTANLLGPERQDELNYANAFLQTLLSVGDYVRHMKTIDYIMAAKAIYQHKVIDREMTGRLGYRIKSLATLLCVPRLLWVPLRVSQKLTQEDKQRNQFYPRNPKPKYTGTRPTKRPEKPKQKSSGEWLTVHIAPT
jgi:hypothetical protein